MLTISRAQHQLFEQDARIDLAHELLDHLRQELPDIWADCDDDSGLEAAQACIERANYFGLNNVGQLWRYAELMSLIGPDFGDSDEHESDLDIIYEDIDDAAWPETRAIIVQRYNGTEDNEPHDAHPADSSTLDEEVATA